MDNTRVSKVKFYILMLIGFIALTGFDRYTKELAVDTLKGSSGITLIEGVLRLTYVENRGAAFGILQGKQVVFWILTAIFLIFAVRFFVIVPKTKKYMPLSISVMVLVAGAVGNFIDRIVNSYVVDFIYFEIIDFPVFNVADICVTLSVTALLILIIFKYKDGDLSFISGTKKA